MSDEDDKRKNNVELTNSQVTNSTITVNQNQDGVQNVANQRVKLAILEDSLQRFPKEQIEKKVSRFYLNMILPILAISADFFGIFAYFGIKDVPIYAVFLPALLFIVYLFGDSHEERWMKKLPSDGKEYHHEKLFYRKDSNGDVERFEVTGPCLEPHCDGHIIISDPPEREAHRLDFVGICSVAQRQHSYEIDVNYSAKLVNFDWTPPPEEKKDS